MPDELTIRRRLVDAPDLVGPFVPPDHPSGGEEILPLAPSRCYLTGFSAPQSTRVPDVDHQRAQGGGPGDTPARGGRP